MRCGRPSPATGGGRCLLDAEVHETEPDRFLADLVAVREPWDGTGACVAGDEGGGHEKFGGEGVGGALLVPVVAGGSPSAVAGIAVIDEVLGLVVEDEVAKFVGESDGAGR
jgi:hypothetical protein